MKTHALKRSFPAQMALCLAVVFALVSGYSQAAEPDSKKPAPASTTKKPKKEKKVIITGSNIPQKVDSLGRIPTTHSPVVIIDQRAIERTGRATLYGVLGTQPYVR